MTGPDPLHYGWWLASRAAGVTAWILVSVAVIAGLLMAGRLTGTPARKQIARQIHEHAALAGLVAMGVHGTTLIGDKFLHPGPAGVLVPFVIGYRPLAVASGIVAAYLAAALGLSFYARRRVGAARWRRLHQFTMLAWLLGLLHGIFAGTDISTVWMQLILLWTAVPILVLFTSRVVLGRRRAAVAAAKAAARAQARASAGDAANASGLTSVPPPVAPAAAAARVQA